VSDEPRAIELTWRMVRSLTNLELARALATAGLRPSEWERAFSAYLRNELEAVQLLEVMTFLYAVAWQAVRRTEPAVTWAEAQSWRVEFNAAASLDELAEAEAVASVDAALVTGLPPREAGELTLAQMEEYRRVRTEAERAVRAPRRGRRAG
jgi:hypothetical protein